MILMQFTKSLEKHSMAMSPVFALVILLSLAFAQGAKAQNLYFHDVGTRVMASYSDYSGEKYKGFPAGTTAVGFEIQSKVTNNFWGFVGGFGFQSLSGSEYIMDSTTERNLDITGYILNLNLGVHFFLIPNPRFTLRPYLGAIGLYQTVAVKLPTDITYTSLSTSETDTMSGSAFVGGFEWAPARGTGGKHYYMFEVRNYTTQGKMFGESAFKLQGLNFLVGFAF